MFLPIDWSAAIDVVARFLHVSPDLLREWVADKKLDLLVGGPILFALRYTWVGLRNLRARLRRRRLDATTITSVVRYRSRRDRHRDSANQGRLPL